MHDEEYRRVRALLCRRMTGTKEEQDAAILEYASELKAYADEESEIMRLLYEAAMKLGDDTKSGE